MVNNPSRVLRQFNDDQRIMAERDVTLFSNAFVAENWFVGRMILEILLAVEHMSGLRERMSHVLMSGLLLC